MRKATGQITIVSLDTAIIMNINPPIIPILCSKMGNWADDPEGNETDDYVFIENDTELNITVSLIENSSDLVEIQNILFSIDSKIQPYTQNQFVKLYLIDISSDKTSANIRLVLAKDKFNIADTVALNIEALTTTGEIIQGTCQLVPNYKGEEGDPGEDAVSNYSLVLDNDSIIIDDNASEKDIKIATETNAYLYFGDNLVTDWKLQYETSDENILTVGDYGPTHKFLIPQLSTLEEGSYTVTYKAVINNVIVATKVLTVYIKDITESGAIYTINITPNLFEFIRDEEDNPVSKRGWIRVTVNEILNNNYTNIIKNCYFVEGTKSSLVADNWSDNDLIICTGNILLTPTTLFNISKDGKYTLRTTNNYLSLQDTGYVGKGYTIDLVIKKGNEFIVVDSETVNCIIPGPRGIAAESSYSIQFSNDSSVIDVETSSESLIKATKNIATLRLGRERISCNWKLIETQFGNLPIVLEASEVSTSTTRNQYTVGLNLNENPIDSITLYLNKSNEVDFEEGSYSYTIQALDKETNEVLASKIFNFTIKQLEGIGVVYSLNIDNDIWVYDSKGVLKNSYQKSNIKVSQITNGAATLKNFNISRELGTPDNNALTVVVGSKLDIETSGTINLHTIAVPTQFIDSSYTIELYLGTILVDSETISCLSDGADGDSPYIMDLDNEVLCISMDEDGAILLTVPLDSVLSVYKDGNKITLSRNNIYVDSISPIIGTITNTIENSDKDVRIRVLLKKGISLVNDKLNLRIGYKNPSGSYQYAVFTILGVRAGEKGEDPSIYLLVPDNNIIKIDKSGIFSPNVLTCNLIVTVGNNEPENTTDCVIKYTIDDNIAENTYPTTGINLRTIKPNKFIKLILYKNDTIVDIESIPVIKDGVDSTTTGAVLRSRGYWIDLYKPNGFYDTSLIHKIYDNTTDFSQIKCGSSSDIKFCFNSDDNFSSSADIRFIDVVYFNGKYWQCTKNHTIRANTYLNDNYYPDPVDGNPDYYLNFIPGESESTTSFWKEATLFDFIVTDSMLANVVNTINLSTKNITLYNGIDNIVAGMTSSDLVDSTNPVRIWAGTKGNNPDIDNAPLKIYLDGTLEAAKGKFGGIVRTNQLVLTNPSSVAIDINDGGCMWLTTYANAMGATQKIANDIDDTIKNNPSCPVILIKNGNDYYILNPTKMTSSQTVLPELVKGYYRNIGDNDYYSLYTKENKYYDNTLQSLFTGNLYQRSTNNYKSYVNSGISGYTGAYNGENYVAFDSSKFNNAQEYNWTRYTFTNGVKSSTSTSLGTYIETKKSSVLNTWGTTSNIKYVVLVSLFNSIGYLVTFNSLTGISGTIVIEAINQAIITKENLASWNNTGIAVGNYKNNSYSANVIIYLVGKIVILNN